ncbi:hypothetical protein CI238_00018 [Colletotrichum incanum]|uniref:Uncharacterized protein n=1 Tax=Colletotrichum incanum TaxID=1573173 RepID=A0A166R287_COLIC|nr:hypothetical protein CI238_00018 [Colletotrichum incanum]
MTIVVLAKPRGGFPSRHCGLGHDQAGRQLTMGALSISLLDKAHTHTPTHTHTHRTCDIIFTGGMLRHANRSVTLASRVKFRSLFIVGLISSFS